MDKIEVAKVQDVDILKIYGKATMKNSQAIADLMDKMNKTPILDLSETTYVDSTFLGLIAKYTMLFKKKNDEFITILKPTEEVLTCLRRTGILKFLIVVDKTLKISGKEVNVENIDNKKLAKHILELHEILMNLNEENRKEFSRVVELMRKGVEK